MYSRAKHTISTRMINFGPDRNRLVDANGHALRISHEAAYQTLIVGRFMQDVAHYDFFVKFEDVEYDVVWQQAAVALEFFVRGDSARASLREQLLDFSQATVVAAFNIAIVAVINK